MRKARFTEHQIIAVIKSVKAGRTVKDVCREAGISEATYYIYGLPPFSSDNDIWTQYPSGLQESEPEQNGLPLPCGYHA